MRATFVLEPSRDGWVAVELEPQTHEERLLLDCWMRYEANAFHVHVERLEDGSLKQVTVVADTSD